MSLQLLRLQSVEYVELQNWNTLIGPFVRKEYAVTLDLSRVRCQLQSISCKNTQCVSGSAQLVSMLFFHIVHT